MPYGLKKLANGKYRAIRKASDGRPARELSHHDQSAKKAKAQIAAIHANEHENGKGGDKEDYILGLGVLGRDLTEQAMRDHPELFHASAAQSGGQHKCSACEQFPAIDSLGRPPKDDDGAYPPTTPDQYTRRVRADLITLPGGVKGTNCLNCKFADARNTGKGSGSARCLHPKVRQWVTERQCCKYWDNDGVHRPWGSQLDAGTDGKVTVPDASADPDPLF